MRVAVLIISGIGLAVIAILISIGAELNSTNGWTLGQALSSGWWLIVLLAVAVPAFVLGLLRRRLKLALALCGGLVLLVLMLFLVTPKLSHG